VPKSAADWVCPATILDPTAACAQGSRIIAHSGRLNLLRHHIELSVWKDIKEVRVPFSHNIKEVD
jgi:hypothetical protein